MHGNDEEIIILYDVVEHFIVVSSPPVFIKFNYFSFSQRESNSLPNGEVAMSFKLCKKKSYSLHGFTSVSLMMLI